MIDDTDRRVRVARVVLLIILLADLVVWTARTLRRHGTPLVIPVAIGALGLLLALRRERLRWMAHAITALTISTLIGTAWMAGGLGSPSLYAMGLAPICAVFLAGRRAGLFWTIVCVGAVGAFKWISALHPDWLTPHEPERALPALGAGLVIVGMYGMGFAYDRARDATADVLRQREAETRSLLQALPDAPVRVDASGRCVQWYAGSGAGLIQRGPGSALAEVFPAVEAIGDAVATAGRTGQEAELERVALDGGKSVTIRVVPRHDGGALLLTRDVTETQRLETRLMEAERRLLRQHTIVEADGGARALEILAESQEYDVILCDVMMPELTGVDLYRQVRAEFPTAADRMVFMTGGAFDARVQELFSSVVGERLVLDKPVDPEALMRLVAERVEVGSATA